MEDDAGAAQGDALDGYYEKVERSLPEEKSLPAKTKTSRRMALFLERLSGIRIFRGAMLAYHAKGSMPAFMVTFVHSLFNIMGAAAVLVVKPLGRIPVRLANRFGEIAGEKKRRVAIFIGATFFAVPIIYIQLSNLLR